MVKQRLFLSMFVTGILLIPAVNADPVKKATEVTFKMPVEIPGMVLQAGTYVIKVPDPVTHADMVGFYNRDESYLYKLVRTIPKYRLDLTDKTVITFEERVKGAPDAVKSWFYPDEYWGREFVYGKAKPLTIAEAAAPIPEPTPAPEVAATEPVVEATPLPAAEPETVAEAPAAPIEVAEALPAELPPAAPIEELPKTGSALPLIALLGGCSLGLGVVLRRVA